eukprot:scaffold11702_cov157-Skeletonema_dohrnii-CCMP3373.AAC.1
MLGSEGLRYASKHKYFVVSSFLIMAARDSATASVFLDKFSVGLIVVLVCIECKSMYEKVGCLAYIHKRLAKMGLRSTSNREVLTENVRV